MQKALIKRGERVFGYIKADKPQMRICEYEAYRSVYCALCRRMGKKYGKIFSSALNFDFTFAAVLGLAIADEDCGFEKKRCCCNPFLKCGYCTEDSGVLDYVSAAAIMMLYFKLLDNIADSGAFKSICYKALKPVSGRAYKKAAKSYPEIAKLFEKQIAVSNANEQEKDCSADKAADPSARLLAGFLAGLSEKEDEKRILDRLGYCIGRWIYFTDAADDFNEDLKNNGFNPLVLKYKELDEKAKAEILCTLNMNISEAAACFNLLDTKRFGDIINNILCLGMPRVQREVLENKFRKDEKLDRSV